MKDIYKKLKQNHNLPEYDKFIKDFNETDLEDSIHPLSDIRKKMCDKIEYFSAIISSHIEPDNNYIDMYETRFINEKDRDILIQTHKKMMFFIRWQNILNITYNQDEEILFINNMFNFWQDIKPILNNHFNHLIDIWKNNKHIKSKVNESYLG